MDIKIKMGKIMKAYNEYQYALQRYNFNSKKEIAERFPQDVVESKEKMLKCKAEFLTTADNLINTINEVEKRCFVRTINAELICETIKGIENRLHNLSKKALNGTSFGYDVNAQDFPRAYKYRPESTQFSAKHNGKEWVITDIWRGLCNKKKCDITLSDTASEALFEKITHY